MYGGGSGIRTHGSLRISGFQDRCNKPLYHPSNPLLDLMPCRSHFGNTWQHFGVAICCQFLNRMRTRAHGNASIAHTSVHRRTGLPVLYRWAESQREEATSFLQRRKVRDRRAQSVGWASLPFPSNPLPKSFDSGSVAQCKS